MSYIMDHPSLQHATHVCMMPTLNESMESFEDDNSIKDNIIRMLKNEIEIRDEVIEKLKKDATTKKVDEIFSTKIKEEQELTKEYIKKLMEGLNKLTESYEKERDLRTKAMDEANAAAKELLEYRSKTNQEIDRLRSELAVSSTECAQAKEELRDAKQRISLTVWLRDQVKNANMRVKNLEEKMEENEKYTREWKRRYMTTRTHLDVTRERLRRAESV